MYTQTVQVRPWSLDGHGEVKVLRHGFPIVPDWSGTAHAYCGSTLEACMGDLLPWTQRPRKDDALKAYIIKSRVRDSACLDFMFYFCFPQTALAEGILNLLCCRGVDKAPSPRPGMCQSTRSKTWHPKKPSKHRMASQKAFEAWQGISKNLRSIAKHDATSVPKSIRRTAWRPKRTFET